MSFIDELSAQNPMRVTANLESLSLVRDNEIIESTLQIEVALHATHPLHHQMHALHMPPDGERINLDAIVDFLNKLRAKS